MHISNLSLVTCPIIYYHDIHMYVPMYIDMMVIPYIGDATFINQLVDFDKDNMSDKVLKKIGTYVNNSDFKPELVGRVSGAAKSLCMWVRAMEVYGRIYRVVEPKRKVST